MSAKDPHSASQKPDSQPPAKADWRRPAAAAATGPVRKKLGGWRERPDREYVEAKRWQRLKRASWSVGVVAMIAVFAYYLWFRPLWTPFVAVAVTDTYDTVGNLPVPPNAWTAEDLQRFEALGERRVIQYLPGLPENSDAWAWESDYKVAFSSLRERLQNTKGGGPGKNLIIVYLSIHGAVNEKGQPCLLLPKGHWLPLEDLLKYLFLENPQGTLAKNLNKLLVLDCSRMDANWRLGILYNRFAERLEEVLHSVNVPGLAILSSAGPGQIGWASPELKGSVFGYFLERGLQGAADREEGGDGDHQVSLRELHRYLKARVDRWVVENRFDRQEPILLPENVDFAVTHAESDPRNEVPEAVAQDDVPWEPIADAWKRHKALEGRGAWQWRPVLWEQLQYNLLRLEQLALAGKAYEGEFGKAQGRVGALLKSLDQSALPPNLPTYNLPLIRKTHDTGCLNETCGQVSLAWTAGSYKLDELGLNPDYTYPAVCMDGWERILTAAEPQQRQLLQKAIDAYGASRKAHPVEWHFARLADKYLDKEVQDRQPKLVQQALLARAEAEWAATPRDERAFYWIRKPVDAADRQRRAAEDGLFVGKPSLLEKADKDFAALLGKEGYGNARELANKVSDAYELRDRAFLRAPHLAQWILARLQKPTPEQLESLKGLLPATHALADQLEKSLQEALWDESLEEKIGDLSGRLKLLDESLANEVIRLKQSAGGDKRTLREIGALLACPLVTGEDRNELRRIFRDIAKRTQADGSQVARDTNSPQPNADCLDRVVTYAVPFTQDMLSRKSLEESSPEAAAHAPASLSQSTDTQKTSAEAPRETLLDRIARQEQAIRTAWDDANRCATAWSKETEERLAGQKSDPNLAEVRSGCSKADRVLRAVAALCDWGENKGLEPADRLRQIDLHCLLLWHCRRTLEDFLGPTPDPGGAEPYFQLVAREYLDGAKAICPNDSDPYCGADRLEGLCESRQKAAHEGVCATAKDMTVDEDDVTAKVDELAIRPPADAPSGDAAVYFSDGVFASEKEEGKDTLRRFDMAVEAPKKDETSPPKIMWVPTEPLKGLLAKNQNRLDLFTLYRGHFRKKNLAMTPSSAGVDLVFAPPIYGDPTVTVHGETTEESAVIFILDYSGSMGEEIGQKRESGQLRYLLARQTLEKILDTLVESQRYGSGRYRVGVIMYGHRSCWEKDKGGRYQAMVWDPDDPMKRNLILRDEHRGKFKRIEDRPPDPSDDVELIHPLRQFNKYECDRIKGVLGQQKPLGQTPLCRAIVAAVEELQKNAPGIRDRHIVAITDGVNWEARMDNKEFMIAADVEAALGKLGDRTIRLDIVGFDLNGTEEQELRQRQDKEAQTVPADATRGTLTDGSPVQFQELLKVAERSQDQNGQHGKFHPAPEPTSLLRALKESLRLTQYEVLRAKLEDGIYHAEEEPIEKEKQLNQLTKLQLTTLGGSTVPTPFVVRIADPNLPSDTNPPVTTSIVVEGGEALELQLVEGGKRLEHRKYDDKLYDPKTWDVTKALKDPLHEERAVLVAAHMPELENNAVRFPISVQNPDHAQFSPRPQEAFVRIRPVGVESPGPKREYIFYDLVFEQERRGPILRLMAPNWPPNAKQAEISVWCKYEKTAPDFNRPVAELRQPSGFQVEGVSDVTLTLEMNPGKTPSDACEVILTERHSEGTDLDLGRLKVEMDRPAAKTTHRLNPAIRTVKHTFLFDHVDPRDVEGYKVVITRFKSLEENAIATPVPLKVEIPREALR